MNQPSRFQIRIIGPDGERVERLHKVELVIGRSAQADIIVANAEVSRRHVTMRVDGDQLLIVDEGSKNGTFLDGVRIPANLPRVWRLGQSLKLGLAPEKLTLEPAVEQKEAPDAPPPMDNMVPRNTVRRNLNTTKPEPHRTDRFQMTNANAPAPKDVELSDPSIRMPAEVSVVQKTNVTHATSATQRITHGNFTGADLTVPTAQVKPPTAKERAAETGKMSVDDAARSTGKFQTRTDVMEDIELDDVLDLESAEVKKDAQVTDKFESKPDKYEAKYEAKYVPKVEPKVQPKVESKIEPKAEAKVQPKYEAKATSKHEVETKNESKVTSRFEAKPEVAVENKATPPVGKAVGGPAILGDLERRMQEVLARAEAEAQSVRQSTDRETKNLKQTIEKEHRQIVESSEGSSLEKAKLESQLRELNEEIKNRSQERKTLAREHAEAKLNLQNAQQEIKRLEAAKTQIPAQLNNELSGLEKKIDKLESHISGEAEAVKSKAQKEAKEIVELAKKQAEMIVSEAEIKAKAQQDKMQGKMTDQRLTTELDLADLKLQQVAELKAAQERLESEFQKAQSHTVSVFLREVREKCEQVVFSSQMDSGLKLRLLTTIEESLHRHFASTLDSTSRPAISTDFSEGATVVRSSQVNSSQTATGIRIKEYEGEGLPPVPRFTLKQGSLAAVCVLGLMAGGLWWKQNSIGQSQMASMRPEPRPIAVPEPVPVAPPPVAVVTPPPEPVAVPVAVTPPTPPPVVATPVQVVEKPVPRAAKPTIVFPPVIVKKSAPTNAAPESWAQVVSMKPSLLWQNSAQTYLESIRVDRRKIKRYQMLEQKFSREVSNQDGRTPASEREQRRLESQFTRDAFELLGATNWAKLMTFRDYYWNKNH